MSNKRTYQTGRNVNVAYFKVEDLLWKLSWKTHQAYGIPLDECKSECDLAFVKAFNWRHKEGKGSKFSSTVQRIATWRLRSLVRDRALAPIVLELNEEIAGFAPPQTSPVLEILEDLSADAQEIIALLLHTPSELLEEVHTPKSLLRNVKKHLASQGRDRAALRAAESEIRNKMNAVWNAA